MHGGWYLIVTIDGPAGSGKSAAALMLAERLHAPHLDTGAMYRTVALLALDAGVLGDEEAVARVAREMDLRFDWSKSPATVWVGGWNVSEAIRQPQVTAVTYISADNLGVREELVRRQRVIGASVPILVTEGRDQGTLVFPKAEFKFYIDAAPEERARRRVAQLAAKGIKADFAEELARSVKRDAQDRARAVGGLARPKDAIVIDTTPLTLEQVVEEMVRIVGK